MPTLPENTSAKLSTLLGRPASGKLITPEHRKVIGQICADAKADGMSVEQLIISLKSLFERIPLSEGAVQTRGEVRDRLVAVCIEEYYRDEARGVSNDGKVVESGAGNSAGPPRQNRPTDKTAS